MTYLARCACAGRTVLAGAVWQYLLNKRLAEVQLCVCGVCGRLCGTNCGDRWHPLHS
jgi:hypothetical protein